MELDNYFVIDKPLGDTNDPRLVFTNSLMGGVFSGRRSDGSFRGKVYADFIENVTGGEHSLYSDRSEPEAISEMLEGIKAWLSKNKGKPSKDICGGYDVSRNEIMSLKVLFEVAVKHNASLTSWY